MKSRIIDTHISASINDLKLDRNSALVGHDIEGIYENDPGAKNITNFHTLGCETP